MNQTTRHGGPLEIVFTNRDAVFAWFRFTPELMNEKFTVKNTADEEGNLLTVSLVYENPPATTDSMLSAFIRKREAASLNKRVRRVG